MANKKFEDYVIPGDNITLTYDNNADTVTIDAAGNVDSVNGQTGVVVLTKTDIGLGNVDNTSDANKPISTATQTALNGKQDTLVSGTNIKTVNSNSLVGSGDVVIDKTSIGLGNVTNVDTTNASNISSGTLSDSRLSANVTTQGNTFNAANKLVQLDGTAKLPAIDGSQLTNLPSFTPPDGLLKIASAISTTFQRVTDYLANNSVLFLNSRRIGIGKDTSVTTQSVAVVEVQDANTSIVLKPNGTGAIIASVPDGSATGGNARGNYAVDLQMNRNASTQVASGASSVISGGGLNTASDIVATIAGGYNNKVSSSFGSIGGGQNNTIMTNSHATISGGQANTASGQLSSVVGGLQNQAVGQYSIAGGNTSNAGGISAVALGTSNTASSNYSTISGGQSNTASTNTHATVVGGQSNTSSGQYSVSGGNGNTASGYRSASLSGAGLVTSGQHSVIAGGNDSSISGNYSCMVGGQLNTIGNGTHNAINGGRSNVINNGVDYSFLGGGQSNLISGASGGADWGVIAGGQSNSIENTHTAILGGNNNYAFGLYSSVLGTKDSYSYLYGSTVSSGGLFSTRGDAQQSNLTARREASLTTAATTTLSLDGTGTTNLIIPNGNNRMWNVQVAWVAVVTAITGTATGVTVGDTKTSTDLLAVAKRGGVTTVSAHTSAGTHAIETLAGSLMAANITYSAGASQEMAITFTGPTFVGGGSVTMRVVARVQLTEVAY